MPKFVFKIASQWRDKPIVRLIVFVGFLAMFIVAARVSVEDYWSTVHGLELIPMHYDDPDMPKWIGALPQIGEIVFFWIASGAEPQEGKAKPGKRRVSVPWLITVVLFFVDSATDIIFRTQGVEGLEWVLLIAFLSITLFTVFSEFLIVVTLQNLWAMGGSVVGALLGGVWKSLKDAWRAAKAQAATIEVNMGSAFVEEPPASKPTAGRARVNGDTLDEVDALNTGRRRS